MKRVCNSEFDDGSDMEPDDDEEWRLVPATGQLQKVKPSSLLAPMCALSSSGRTCEIGGQLSHVAQYGTFNDEEFPLASPWIGKGARNLHIYVLEDKDLGEDNGKPSADPM